MLAYTAFTPAELTDMSSLVGNVANKRTASFIKNITCNTINAEVVHDLGGDPTNSITGAKVYGPDERFLDTKQVAQSGRNITRNYATDYCDTDPAKTDVNFLKVKSWSDDEFVQAMFYHTVLPGGATFSAAHAGVKNSYRVKKFKNYIKDNHDVTHTVFPIAGPIGGVFYTLAKPADLTSLAYRPVRITYNTSENTDIIHQILKPDAPLVGDEHFFFIIDVGDGFVEAVTAHQNVVGVAVGVAVGVEIHAHVIHNLCTLCDSADKNDYNNRNYKKYGRNWWNAWLHNAQCQFTVPANDPLFLSQFKISSIILDEEVKDFRQTWSIPGGPGAELTIYDTYNPEVTNNIRSVRNTLGKTLNIQIAELEQHPSVRTSLNMRVLPMVLISTSIISGIQRNNQCIEANNALTITRKRSGDWLQIWYAYWVAYWIICNNGNIWGNNQAFTNDFQEHLFFKNFVNTKLPTRVTGYYDGQAEPIQLGNRRVAAPAARAGATAAIPCAYRIHQSCGDNVGTPICTHLWEKPNPLQTFIVDTIAAGDAAAGGAVADAAGGAVVHCAGVSGIAAAGIDAGNVTAAITASDAAATVAAATVAAAVHGAVITADFTNAIAATARFYLQNTYLNNAFPGAGGATNAITPAQAYSINIIRKRTFFVTGDWPAAMKSVYEGVNTIYWKRNAMYTWTFD
jgi:hypothetical protein